MPRTARKKSSTGVHHVMLRGINGQSMFEDDEDNELFLQILRDCKTVSLYELYAYCLMGNHVHLLIKEGQEDLGHIFKRVGSRYVGRYNWKYSRSGHLFQDRFKSEPISDDAHFLTAMRYIHQNPIKAGLSRSLDEYRWSSYCEYINGADLVDTGFAQGLLGKNSFIQYMSEAKDDVCMDIDNKKRRLTDAELTAEIELCFAIKAMMIQNEPKERRRQLLKDILRMEGVTTRQLSRVTGISTNVIWKL
jgi:REP element-mobilizing transposase RayT